MDVGMDEFCESAWRVEELSVRLLSTDMKEEKQITLLTRDNYLCWREEVEDQCLIKAQTEEKIKIAFLRQRLSTAHKNELRAAMREEAASDEQRYEIDVQTHPYSWALRYIEDRIVRRGRATEELAERAEQIKADMAKTTVEHFGYNLTRFHNAFHKKEFKVFQHVEEPKQLIQALAQH